MSEWISVEHGLPPLDGEYLALVKTVLGDDSPYTRNILFQVVFDKGRGWTIILPRHAFSPHNWLITHWRQLPAPPRESE